MQNRYAGDIGDFIKFALLRALSTDHDLGVAWYLYPDEGHNSDGKHISYLENPRLWRHLDPGLFNQLAHLVRNERSVAAIEASGILDATFSNEVMGHDGLPWRTRSEERERWFERVLGDLAGSNLVFADPDNGLVDDNPRRRQRKGFGKRMPINEVQRLAKGRTAIVYHHNSRFKGGHDREVDHWLDKLGRETLAIRANAYSCRTFFVINPSQSIRVRVEQFCDDWKDRKVTLHRRL